MEIVRKRGVALQRKISRLIPIVVLCFLFVLMFPSIALAEESDASSAVNSARQRLLSCFFAARQVEDLGANISSLTSALNDAGGLLSLSESAYSRGDFVEAQNLAHQSVSRLNGFASEASTLRDAAVRMGYEQFLWNLGWFVAGMIVLAILVFSFFRFIKGGRVETGGLKTDAD